MHASYLKPVVDHRVLLFVLCGSVGFAKCLMTCIRHDGIRHNTFTTLKIPCAHLFIPSLVSLTSSSHRPFTGSTVLPVLERHVVGLAGEAAFAE